MNTEKKTEYNFDELYVVNVAILYAWQSKSEWYRVQNSLTLGFTLQRDIKMAAVFNTKEAADQVKEAFDKKYNNKQAVVRTLNEAIEREKMLRRKSIERNLMEKINAAIPEADEEDGGNE